MATMKEKTHYNTPKTIATVYRKMSQEKKDIVEEMGFGALAHVPKMNGTIYITPRKVAAALGITNGENFFPEKVDYNKLNPADKECAGYETEQAKDNAAEKRKRALEMIRKKRSKKRNNGAQSTNIAPDQFDSPQTQNDFSQTVPTINMDSEQVLQTQGSSTPSVNAASNIRPPLALSLPSSVQEELMKDDFIYVLPQEETQQTSNNDCPQEAEKQALQKNNSNKPKNHRYNNNQNKKHLLMYLWNSPAKNQQRNNPNKKHLLMWSFTSSVIEEFFKDANVYQVSDEEQSQEPQVAWQSEKETLILSSFDSAAQPKEREDERTSFSLGISPPASQPTQPSKESDSQLEILAEMVVDAGVAATLKFDKGTSSESTLTAAQVYKTPQKKTKITNELIKKCYHWMTHVKKTKDGTNKYETVFVLKHEGLYEGLREYFMSLMPKEDVHAVVVSIHSIILNEIKMKQYQKQIYIVPQDIVNFMLGTYGVEYTDKRTNKAYMFDIEQYAHHRQFLDKRKLVSHPFLFVPICNGGHWWLWIADVNKKKFYVLDPINKKLEDIPNSRKELNKFVGLIISQMRVYAGAEPLMEDGLGEEGEYIQLNSQRTK
ncbi:uncharacterized protein DS421_14g446430 [Arachis hypogaea]|nr:uncharacterized protein DS421_14g446430 [Arachis hypogaea]